MEKWSKENEKWAKEYDRKAPDNMLCKRHRTSNGEEGSLYRENWPRVQRLLQESAVYESKREVKTAFGFWKEIVKLNPSLSGDLKKAEGYIKSGIHGCTKGESVDLALRTLELMRNKMVLEWASFSLEQICKRHGQ
jgi:hypothetical protein